MWIWKPASNIFQHSYIRCFTRSLQNNAVVEKEDFKLFLQQKNVKYINGWTCYECSNIFNNTLLIENKQTFQKSSCYINKTTGDFFCPSLEYFGSWKAYKKAHEKGLDQLNKTDYVSSNYNSFSTEEILKSCPPINTLNFEMLNKVIEKFQLRALDLKHFDLFDIRCKVDTKELVIPYYGLSGESKDIKGVKIIHDSQYCSNKNCESTPVAYTLVPHSDSFNLFGLDKVDVAKKRIVLTANEFDAIAINVFSNNYSAVALPFGTSTLPLRILPFLEKFSEIILWFGSDVLSLEAMQQFAKKLVSERCRAVKPPRSSSTAFDAVKLGIDINSVLSSAVPTDLKNLVSFSDLHDEVKHALSHKDESAGISFKRFWNLNKKLKGHRSGELTVVTGPTGSGKTTLVSELSLDLAMQGVKTLWGSFEISNKRLIMCMLKQFSQCNVETNMDKFEEISCKFKQLPLTFMTYNGPKNIEEVIQTMFEATYCYDIQHIIIDNLQFMIGCRPNLDRFAYQDYVISKFREFASKYQVHVTLVVHPRKEDHYMPLQLSSIFGSAKVTQEADNVLILQVKQPDKGSKAFFKYLEVAKNRYDGELGRIKLYFNHQNLCMSPQFKDNFKDRDVLQSETLQPGLSKPNVVFDVDTSKNDNGQNWIGQFRNSH